MSLSARQQSGKLLGVANFKICAGLPTHETLMSYPPTPLRALDSISVVVGL